MRARAFLGFCALFLSTFALVIAQAQQDSPSSSSQKSAEASNNDPVVEGTVVSKTRNTLVVRTDDDQYHLYTYQSGYVRDTSVAPGARVRVNGTAPDENGTQVASNVTVLQPAAAPASGGQGVHAAPPPPQVQKATSDIENDARRWHVGGRIGAGFSPEIFLFGLQSQIGPFFSPHLMFRPNAEFGFGELTDMLSFNIEGAYRLNTTFRGKWAPYFGVGPSLNFIHQGASSGGTSFSNFDYKTGFNVFLGAQKRNTFVEMKTSLWSGKAPVLRLLIGYNF